MAHNMLNQTNKNREHRTMKHILEKLAFIILLIGQIIFYCIAFPGLLIIAEIGPGTSLALLFTDLSGVLAWNTAWYLDHRAGPRTWQTNVRIVTLIFWSLVVFRLQFYAW